MRHFTMRELIKSPTAQRLDISNEPTEAVKANLTALVEHILDPLREAWGAHIIVTRGNRSECAVVTTDRAVFSTLNAEIHDLITNHSVPLNDLFSQKAKNG